jgi:hypothetical protein
MDPEQMFIGRALGRIQLLIAFLSGSGTLAALVYGGWRWALGYILGGAAGYLNFRWLKRLVGSLGEAAGGKHPGAWPCSGSAIPAAGRRWLCYIELHRAIFGGRLFRIVRSGSRRHSGDPVRISLCRNMKFG